MTEEWPVWSAARLFHAQEQAELEHRLRTEAAQSSRLVLYLLRPPIVLGPHTVGAKRLPLAPLARRLARRAGGLPVQELDWAPRFTALEALRDTLRPGPEPDRTSP